jgi:sugar phosphate isomerase/epimerase
MQRSQIALQLYTLRDHCRSRDAFVETCRRVAEIGYQAVQVSGIDRAILPEREIAAVCRDHALTICASHEAADEILARPADVVRRLRDLGCTMTAYPYPKDIDFASEAGVAKLIAQLEAAGRVLADAGMVLAYHNHQIEFRRLNGTLLLERIFAETSPQHLAAELDTYWVQFGGGDPASWCRRLTHRLPLLHLKDFRINAENQIEFAEVGSGNLNFPEIIGAAEAAGCQWFIVEQDRCPGDPFVSIAQSFQYLVSLT